MTTHAVSRAKKRPVATQTLFSAEKREIVPVAVDQIQFDTRQPREAGAAKTANIDNIGSTLDVDAEGVAHPIHPVQIRKTPPWAEDQSKPWMMFDGECRATSAINKGAVAIDAVEIVIPEEKVFEFQVLTAMAREGLGPVAQLEAIRRFDAEHSEVNAANAAMRLGMKTDVVRGLRKVNGLPAEVRLRFMGGEHTLEVCDAIGKIDGATTEEKVSRQEAASRAVVKMDPKKAREHILKTYLLRLKDAPFDREDKTLFPTMGVCSACPYRTEAQSNLFGSADTADDCCTKKSCWDQKASVTVERQPPPEEPKEKAKKAKPGKPTPEDVGVAAKLAAGADPNELDALFPDKTREELDAALERLDAHGNPKAGPALQDRRAKGKDLGGFSRGSAYAIASVAVAGVRDAMGRLSPADTALFLRWVLENTGGFLMFIEPGSPTYDPCAAAISAVRRAIEDVDPSALPSFVADVSLLMAGVWDHSSPKAITDSSEADGPPSIDEDPVDDNGAEPDPKEESSDAEDDWREVPE